MNANAITKYAWIGYTSARSNLAYIGEVLSRTLFMGTILYIFMRLWTAVYTETGAQRLGGLTLRQMIWYLVITESIFISSPRVSAEIDEDVRTGRLSVQLLKPLSYGIAKMAQVLGERSIRFGMNAITGMVVALVLVGPIEFSATGLAMFALVLPLAFVVDFLGFFAIGLCAFWMESTIGLTLIYARLTMLLGGMMMPLEVFPAAVQPIVRALPFASMVYGPARVFVTADRTVFIHALLAQAAAFVVFACIAWIVERAAVKCVQSNGG
jgi:ABC-2 type transport system permease protein